MISFKKNGVDRAQLINHSAQPTAGTHTARSWLFVSRVSDCRRMAGGTGTPLPPLPATDSHNSSQRPLGEGWQGMTHCWQKTNWAQPQPSSQKAQTRSDCDSARQLNSHPALLLFSTTSSTCLNCKSARNLNTEKTPIQLPEGKK